jgi:hypothetical protein
MNPVILLSLLSLVSLVIAVIAVMVAGAAQREARRAHLGVREEKARMAKDREYLERLQDSVARGVGLLARHCNPTEYDRDDGHTYRDCRNGRRDPGGLH